MKASTTLLYQLLGRHPDVWFPSEKEPHYFTKPQDDPASWNEYLRLFADCPAGKRAIGEASTGYSKLPFLGPTPRRIHEKLGDVKLIYILRDPLARAISNYRHAYARGHYAEGLTFGGAIERDPIIVAASCYERQLRAYEDVFGEDAMLVVLADELHANAPRVMSRIETHLGLDPFDQWHNAPLPAINSADSVRTSAGWTRVIGKTWTRRLSGIAPVWAKRRLRGALAPSVPKPPAVSATDENRCLELLRDDLSSLALRLGDRIENWASIKRLGIATKQNGPHDQQRRGIRFCYELETAGA